MSANDQYEIECEFRADGNIPITKYVSKTTGLKIYNCKVDGPRVVCHLTLATDASGNEGLPYALQNLIFMGSESHPYQGVLKKLTHDCETLSCWVGSSVTIDHSSYEIHAVGATGVLNLLPIYLEHIFYPALTESAFLTEIHHVNGEGIDAGTMYCERMDCENDAESLCQQAIYQAVYPGEYHYAYDVKGLTKDLRENITIEKVREYHKTFYRLDNLAIIIVGDVEANDIFRSISAIVDKIAQKDVGEKLSFPWRCSVSPLSNSTMQVVEYPSDDSNEKGIAFVSWRGPSIHQIEDCTALELLIKYLCISSSSPLQQAFVTTADSYCDDVLGSILQAVEICLYIQFKHIVKAKQSYIKDRLLEILSDISSGKQEINMKKMSAIIHKKKIALLTELESNPHDAFSCLLTTDFLYGQTSSELERRMNQIHTLESVADKDVSFWQQLLKKYLLTENIIVVIGEPSVQLQEKLSSEESKRIEKQKSELGEEGLKRAEDKLQEARDKNKTVIENEILTSVLLPSADSIKFHQVIQSCNYEGDPLYDCNLKDIPCGFQLDNMKTNFFNVWVLLDTDNLSLDLRLYLPLFMNVLVKSVISQENGGEEEISAQVENGILEVSVEISSSDYSSFTYAVYDQIALIKLKIEEKKYEKAIRWLRELLYERELTQLLIQECISKEVQKLLAYKGINEMASYNLSRYLIYGEGSNFWCGACSRQYNFLIKLLDTNLEGVAEKIQMLRRKLLDPNNIVIHVAANVEKLGQNSLSIWNNLTDLPQERNIYRHKICMERKGLEQLESSTAKSYIVDAGPDAQCLMFQLGKGVNSWNDPDLPALRVLNQYLIQMQGVLWSLMKDVAFSYLIWTVPGDGIVYLYIAAKEDLISAYKEMKGYVCDIFNDKLGWDETLIEFAKSGAINNIVEEKESTLLDVSMESLLSYFNETTRDYTRKVIDKICQVTVEDLKKVGVKYLLPLFDPAKSACFISSSTSALQSTVVEFKELSRDLNVVTDDSIFGNI